MPRLLSLLALAILAPPAAAQDIEQEPILYSTATPDNPVVALQKRLAEGTAALDYEQGHGYLRSLLKALEIDESSQVLVFSKTSLQRERISPKTPRAIYFNDEVMVGFCLRGGVIELSAADAKVGTAFYTLDQARDEAPIPVRQTESCMICHSSSANRGMPGHLVRSVFVDRQGQPLLASGSYRTDHESPLEERWGGWYVTGTSGDQQHLGNLISQGPNRPARIDNADGVNVTDLKERFTVGLYPTPHSDIVALMVLEHQVGMLNRLARANLETRMALHYEQEMNKSFGRAEGEESESARSRIRSACEDVVRYMLFADEALLTGPIVGTSSFTTDFPARGPRDPEGRSLRDLDLRSRLFRYPCSYLIYSRAFSSLPGEAKARIYLRLREILTSPSEDDPQLSAPDRAAIISILRATLPDLPDDWRSPRGE